MSATEISQGADSPGGPALTHRSKSKRPPKPSTRAARCMYPPEYFDAITANPLLLDLKTKTNLLLAHHTKGSCRHFLLTVAVSRNQCSELACRLISRTLHDSIGGATWIAHILNKRGVLFVSVQLPPKCALTRHNVVLRCTRVLNSIDGALLVDVIASTQVKMKRFRFITHAYKAVRVS